VSNDVLFVNATVYTPGEVLPDGWVRVEGGRITGVGAGGHGGPPKQEWTEVIDLGGHILAPGFIDLHVHGALGHDTMDADPEALRAMARFYARHGVTAFLATTMTAPAEAILAALETVARVRAEGTDGASLLGAHVEGPYLDVERRGCQEAVHVRPADPAEYRRLLETGAVRLLTLAPEYPENRELIREATSRGVAVAAGHTRASYDVMVEAVGLGLSQVTHLFNGMEPLHHRAPGAVGAGLALDALRCQVIADNVHVHPAALKLAARAKGPDGVILVTDAMAGTGMPDGEYTLGGVTVTVRGGVARDPHGALAGSTLTMERAVANMAAASGMGLAAALTMATRTPARAIGMGERKGRIAPGLDADLVALTEDLTVALTVVAGEVVCRG
jgi:N-acetylglucosamine-6-phosphate deacetylase